MLIVSRADHRTPTARDVWLSQTVRFALAPSAESRENRSIRSAPLTVPELAFRPRCYAAADIDTHWNTQTRELPLAAYLISRPAAEPVATVRGTKRSSSLGDLDSRCSFGSSGDFPSRSDAELAFRPRCYAAADIDTHWNTQRPALALAALRSVSPCCRASSFGREGKSFFRSSSARRSRRSFNRSRFLGESRS